MTSEQLEEQARADWQWLLEDERGRRVARTLRRWSLIDDVPPSGPIEHLARQNGMREVGWRLMGALRTAAPDGWLQLEAEHLQELEYLRTLRLQEEAKSARDTAAQGTP